MSERTVIECLWYLILAVWWIGSVVGFVASGILWHVTHVEMRAVAPGDVEPTMLVALCRFRRQARVRFMFSLAFMLVVPLTALLGQPPPDSGACVQATVSPWFSLFITGAFAYVVWANAVASSLDFRDRKRLMNA